MPRARATRNRNSAPIVSAPVLHAHNVKELADVGRIVLMSSIHFASFAEDM
jgi:hypothetical protein